MRHENEMKTNERSLRREQSRSQRLRSISKDELVDKTSFSHLTIHRSSFIPPSDHLATSTPPPRRRRRRRRDVTHLCTFLCSCLRWCRRRRPMVNCEIEGRMNDEGHVRRSLCCGCLSVNDVEHVCSSQIFSDSMSSLSELCEEELSLLNQFSLEGIELRGEEDLRQWHQSAKEHLQTIFEERLESLRKTFEKDLLSPLEQTTQNILQINKEQIFPRLHQFIEHHHSRDTSKIEFIRNYVSILKGDVQRLSSRCWLSIHLPDLNHFSIPIRIAKMPLAATLTEQRGKNKDPLEQLSDEEKENIDIDIDIGEKEKEKKKEEFDIFKIFTLNHLPKKIFPLEGNSSTLAFSSIDHRILIHDQKKLILFNFNEIISELPWNDNEAGILVDMSWMSSIRSFVILTIHSVYLLDPLKCSSSSSSSSSLCPMKIDSIRPLDRTHVWSSLCSFDDDLLLTSHKGIHLEQYRFSRLSSEWILHKRFSKEECSEKTDLGIRDVRSDGEFLCLSILQEEDLRWRLDLFSKEMIRLRRGVTMDSAENQHKFFSMLIPLINDQQRWLFVNWFTNQLWTVDQQGKTRIIKEAKMKNIRNLLIDSSSTHLVIRTDKPSLLQIFSLSQ